MSTVLEPCCRSRWSTFAIATAGVIAISGSAFAQTAAKPLTPVSFRLGFIAGAWDAGEYVARELGYYKEAGLDVTITEGQGSNSNIQLLSSGQVEFAKIAASSLAVAGAKGAKLKMLASHLQVQGSGVATKTEIKTIQDMSGKTYTGVTFDVATQLFPAYVKATGITNVKVVNVAPESIPQVLVAGQTDMMVANAWSQVPIMESLGAKFNYFPYTDQGLDPLGIGLVAADSTLEKKADIAKAMVAATMRGWQYVYANPEKATDIFIKAVPSIKRDLALKTISMMEGLSHTPSSKGQPLGWMAEEDWVRTIDILTKGGILTGSVKPSDLYINLVAK